MDTLVLFFVALHDEIWQGVFEGEADVPDHEGAAQVGDRLRGVCSV